MRIGRVAVLLVAFAGGGTAQVPAVERTICGFDGVPWEQTRGPGRRTIVRDAARVKAGGGAIEVAPAAGKRWAVQVDDVDARGATALLADVFHTGSRRAWIDLEVRDAAYKRRGDRLHRKIDLEPGWNAVVVDLVGAKTADGKRAIAFDRPLRSLRLGRGGPKDAFVVDRLRLRLAPLVKPKKLASRARRGLSAKLADDQILAVRSLERLPVELRVAELVRLVRPRSAPWIRMAALRGLARCPAGVFVATERFAGSKPPVGAGVVAMWGNAADADAHAAAVTLATDAKTAESLRIAALVHATRAGSDALVPAATAAACDGSWPLRVAGVRALRHAATPAAVDGLIDALAAPAHARVALEIHEALVALTGQDYGDEVSQWKGWWAKNRDSVRPGAAGAGRAPRAAGGYARFYGVAVRGERIAFILDISGSMREPIGSKRARKYIADAKHLADAKLDIRLDLAKAELAHVLSKLPAKTRFNVGFFNDEVMWLHREAVVATPEAVEDTIKRVQRINASQGTNVHDGLVEAMTAAWARRPEPHPDTVFLLSDGVPSAGPVKRFDALADVIEEVNLTRQVRINTILVGDKGGRFLRRIARDAGGRFVNVGG